MGKEDGISRLYRLIVSLPESTSIRELLRSILLSLGSAEKDPSSWNRFDAMYCLRFMAGIDQRSAEELKEHVAYSYEYVDDRVDLDSPKKDISAEIFDMLQTRSTTEQAAGCRVAW